MFGLSALATKAIIAAVIVGLIFSGGLVTAHKFDEGRYQKLKAEYAQAQATALAEAVAKQRLFDNIALIAAQKERDEQAQRATQAETQLADVGNHVSLSVISPTCVPLGFVRLLDAAASGRSASALLLPAGKSDGSCSPVGWNIVARSVIGNYATARANSLQLNSIIDAERQAQKAR